MTVPQKFSEIKISDLPQNIISEMSDMIHKYSTLLTKVSIDRTGKEIVSLIGSGTFITVGDITGILTAEHVVNLLDDTSFNGPPKFLGLVIKKHVHRCAIEREHIRIHKIARGTVDSEGPDLAFIGIPLAKLGTIRAEKSFYNLQRDRDRMLSSPPKSNLGVWAICGAPDIETTNGKSTQGLKLKGYKSYCFFAGVSRIYDIAKFDYLEIQVRYDCHPDIPESFGGISGGGVWQIPLVQKRNGEMKPQEYLLSGIAFYQTEKSGSRRLIRCHSRKSIYDIAYGSIEKMCSKW